MSEIPVQPDQVYTLDLGVMVEGRGYLGFEEMVLVTNDGCVWLSERRDDIPLAGIGVARPRVEGEVEGEVEREELG